MPRLLLLEEGEATHLRFIFPFRFRVSTHSASPPRVLLLIADFLRADFDEDGMLGPGDLERTCRQLTRGDLSAEEVATVCRKVLEESDIDGDGALSYMEFEHVVTRSSDFMATFHIRT